MLLCILHQKRAQLHDSSVLYLFVIINITTPLLGVAAAARTAVAVVMRARPLSKDSTVSSPPPLGQINLLDRVPAKRIRCDRVRNRLGVEQIRLLVQVVDVISGLVVVDIICHARLAAKEDSLLRRLDLLSAGEQTARRDAVLDEAGVVGATAEFGRDRPLTGGAEKVFKLLLDSTGAGGASEVEGTAIAVVDTIDVVGAGDLCFFSKTFRVSNQLQEKLSLDVFGVTNHVKVKISAELSNLGLGAVDGVDVVVRA